MEAAILRLNQVGNNLPMSFILDPSAEFLPGQCAQLTVNSNTVMATVSNGRAPIGIIDDIRTRAFVTPAWNETIIVPAQGVINPQTGQLVTPVDIQTTLKNAYVDPNSFLSTVDVALIPVNGMITFLAGTPLNLDLGGTGTLNAIKTVVNYTYQVANIPGDDSTLGSGRMTVWFTRGFYQVDQFETQMTYPVNANLYVSERGLFTTRKPGDNYPVVAICSAPPQPMSPFLELCWL